MHDKGISQRSKSHLIHWLKATGLSLLMAACSSSAGTSSPALFDRGDTSGLDELQQPLVALATPPAFATGALTVTVATGEIAVISRHPVNGNILVNDVVTAGVTATTCKTITVNGSGGADTVIIDFANGTFTKGTATTPGITVAFGAGADVFKVRGSGSAVDNVTVGGTETAANIAFDSDAYKDIVVTGSGTVAYTFSLGGGADVFNANSGANGTGGSAFTGAVTVYGGLGDDVLTGGDGDDTIYGDVGNDSISGGTNVADNDVLSGGAGTDTVTYKARTLAIIVTVGAGADDGDVAGGETDDVQSDVETVVGGSGPDTFIGTSGDQTFYGGAGDDVFDMGLLASDGAGNDTVYGEAGNDTVTYASRLEAVTATMDSNVANDGNPTAAEHDNIRNDVENFVCPTAAVACIVTGNTLDNVITGGAGDDVFVGGAGDDTFIVGDAADIGQGADSFSGGAGVDTVSFAGFAATIDVIMDFTASTTMGKLINTDVENLTCPTADACVVTGNAAANRIVGSSADDTVDSAGGDDIVETGGGSDTVECGDGSDLVTGGGATATNCEL